eukprot:s3220_g11.t1
MEENVKGEVVEHVVVEQHPYEMVTRTCWEMSGAEDLQFPVRLADHRTKVNAVTRGQPGRDVSKFDDGMWLDLEDFMEQYCKMLPKKVNPPRVEELVALLYHDNKARFEFKCAAGLQTATRKGLAYWPFKIRAVQGNSERAMKKAAAPDMFNAVMIYAATGADAVMKASVTGMPVTAGNQVDQKLHPAVHTATLLTNVEAEYKSGLRAGAPIEIRVAMREAVQGGVVFFRTASDGILTKDEIDPKFIISIEDTVNKKMLFQRKDVEQATAKSSGEGAKAGGKVGKIVQKIEGKSQTFAQSSAPATAASASDYVAPTFGSSPMKIKPPPPAYAAKKPGQEQPPKAEVPKAAEPPKAKAPTSVPSPPAGPPPQNKAAVAGEPKAVPAAQPPVKILEQKSKTPPGSPSKAKQQATQPAPPPPKAKAESVAPEPRTATKIESYSCKRCCAQVFAGQVECDGCGLVLEPTQAQRAKIAERRKEAIRNLGLRYDFRGDFLKQLTREQLAGLGVTDPQDRGSRSPEAELLKRARGRLEKALDLGYTSVLDRFTMDTVFTETVLNEGENEYDCERFAKCHLPKPDRDRVQVRLGNSQNSQLEHMSARLVYIDLPRVNMLPDRFRYIGELWLVMFRTEVYSLEEYKDYLQRNPSHNLLTTNYGVERIQIDHFDEQLQELKGLNEPVFRKNIQDKIQQSAKAKQRNLEEAKRKAEGPAASQPRCRFSPCPSWQRARSWDVAKSSSSSSARPRQDPPPRPAQTPHPAEYYETGEWEKWDGRWYQKVYYHGRAEWQQWRGR